MKIFSSIVIVFGGTFLFAASGAAQLPSNNPSQANAVSRPGRNGAIRTPPSSADAIAEELDRAAETGERPVYRMHKVMREKLRITDEEKAGFKKSLNDGKANIARLLSAFSCSTSLVIDLRDPRCLENPDPFEGSYYSFRYKDYGESPWTDLNLIEDEFTAGNKWNTVGLIVDLGEGADFAKLDESAKEVKTLWDLPGAETLEEKTEQRAKLEKGFTYEEVFVGSKAKVQPNHKYLLRTIAYRIESGFAAFRSAFNWYNTDSVFVFKVVEANDQRVVTVGWKKLMQRVAPMLKEKEKKKTQ
jgi:hypothetical protein